MPCGRIGRSNIDFAGALGSEGGNIRSNSSTSRFSTRTRAWTSGCRSMPTRASSALATVLPNRALNGLRRHSSLSTRTCPSIATAPVASRESPSQRATSPARAAENENRRSVPLSASGAASIALQSEHRAGRLCLELERPSDVVRERRQVPAGEGGRERFAQQRASHLSVQPMAGGDSHVEAVELELHRLCAFHVAIAQAGLRRIHAHVERAHYRAQVVAAALQAQLEAAELALHPSHPGENLGESAQLRVLGPER